MGCVKVSGGVEKSNAGIVEIYACQFLSSKSDLKDAEELMKAAQVYLVMECKMATNEVVAGQLGTTTWSEVCTKVSGTIECRI